MSKKGRKGRSTTSGTTTFQRRLQEARSRSGRSSPANAPPRLVEATQTKPSAKPEPVRVAEYADVSAVRIQEWILRTPDLRLRRGASILLTESTGRAAWESQLSPPVRWNDEAGDLDGVVSLCLEGDADDQSEDLLARAARDVAVSLRRTLPHLAIQAVAGSGPTYAHAFEEMERRRRRGELLVDAPAPPAEVVLGKPCDACRSDPVEHPGVPVHEKPKDLCGDCFGRHEATGGTQGDWLARSPLPERKMLTAVQQRMPGVRGFSDDFRSLARGPQREGNDVGADTQLALIYADGNRVGAFLTRAAESARTTGSPSKAHIVTVVEEATLAALGDAVAARHPDETRPQILAHIAGGDDLQVSVPAADGWAIVRNLLDAFDERIREATLDWPEPVRRELPCLSAGLVFHHASHPYSDAVGFAATRLKAAKRATGGSEPTVSFLDLTADGERAPERRRHPTLRWLAENAVLLDKTCGIPRGQRETYLALLRQAQQEPTAGVAGRDAATGGLRALARRLVDLGASSLWEVVASAAATATEVRRRVEGDPGARDALRDHLDIARWWCEDQDTHPQGGARE